MCMVRHGMCTREHVRSQCVRVLIVRSNWARVLIVLIVLIVCMAAVVVVVVVCVRACVCVYV